VPQRAPAVIDAPDLATRLAAVESELHQLRDTVDRLIAARRPIADDAQFLAAIANAVHDHVFTARELRNHATVDAALRAAIGGATVKQIGKRLRRVAGQWIGSYRALWTDRDNDGNIWKLEVAAAD
jgi:hypothetical protein